MVNPGDRINVTLIVDNLGKLVKSTDVEDTIPSGFSIVDQSESGDLQGDTLTFKDVVVSGKSSYYLRYTLEYQDSDSLGLDFFPPAEVSYDNKTSLSPRIPFIRRYQPKQNLYLLKRLEFLDKDSIRVTLTLQNLGETSLKDVQVQEALQTDDEFREITQVPDNKGLWKIPLLPPGQSWTVSYVTNENERVNSLPEVYGVDRSAISKSIVLVHTIESTFTFTSTGWIEIVGSVLSSLVSWGMYFSGNMLLEK